MLKHLCYTENKDGFILDAKINNVGGARFCEAKFPKEKKCYF